MTDVDAGAVNDADAGAASGVRWRWWLLGALVAVAAVAIYVVTTGDDGAERAFAVPGVDEAALRVTTADGREVVGCVLVADSKNERSRGLMEVTDLGEHDGMAFVFETLTTSGFWMRNTPTPLTIAYYDAEARFVAATDMAPCGDRIDCPSYPPPSRPYRVAIEVPQGRAPALGLTPGSTARVGGACA